MIIIDNHNFDSVMNTGNIYLQGSTDNSNWVNILTDMTSADNSVINRTFNSTTYRYWRIYYNGIVIDFPYIGTLFLDSYLQFPLAQDYGYSSNDSEYNTVSYSTLNGTTVTSQPHDGRSRWNVNFKLINNTFRNAFIQFVKTCKGKMLPFYYIDIDGSTTYMRMETDYQFAEVMSWNQNDIKNFKMKTVDISSVIYQVISDYSGMCEDTEYILSVS